MKVNEWNSYPVIAAMILGTSGTLFLFTGFYFFDDVAETESSLLKLQLKLAAAIVLWVIGCGVTSRTRHASWTKGLLCGLFFVPGLIFLVLTTGGKSRQEIWQEANPELVGKNLRRQYRDVKPLY